MTSQWTDERLDRFANKVDDFIESSRERETRLDSRIDNLVTQIGNLIGALHLELPNIKAEIHGIGEEAREQRETLHAELVELKEVAKQQAIAAQIQAEAAKAQADTAKTQAENIRLMIEMVNRKQA